MSLMPLPERLKSLREKHNLTQQNIGDYLNITRQGYSHYENGTRMPDVHTLEQLATLYCISLEELLTGNKSPKEEIAETKGEYFVQGLSPERQKILYYYSQLTPEYKDAFFELLMIKWQRNQSSKQKKRK